jgi:purine-nucleoside phosphorylase
MGSALSASGVALRLQAAADAVRERSATVPKIAIVLGSGLGGLAEAADVELVIPYADIPHFPASTAPGHAGRLLLGRLESRPVALLSGRAHLYEGYSPEEAVFAVRLMRYLGAEALIVTNAAGGINPAFHPGTLMLICDHINLTGQNPLVGFNDPDLGLRFPDMSEAYDGRLRALARRASDETGIELAEGIYMGLLGPNYETPAEVRMLRKLGSDAVGMSTVLEVIAANHAGLRVLGISCITNMAAGMLPQKLTEEEVIETANRVRDEFSALVRRIVRDYGDHAA